MPEYIISGIPVHFPFEPYDVQKDYMEKLISCLRDGTNGVLESPTGTGKTLSLLCATLAWVLSKKQELQKIQKEQIVNATKGGGGNDVLNDFNNIEKNTNPNWGIPKVIYASRTHSQLTQAMQELKRTAYSFMRAVVLGSRDQLCIHPEVTREVGNSTKIQMCKLRVETRTCSFYLHVDTKKEHPDFRGPTVMDIEDLVTVGKKLKMCPYFGSKELVADADITFMPYNYLLDHKGRKANKIELTNTIVILDEAHNIEKICEDSASVQIKSSDVAMAIEDVTHIMKALESAESQNFGSDEAKDFNMEDLVLLKEMLLDFEKAIDDIIVDNLVDGTTYPANYMFNLLGKANFNYNNAASVVALLDKLLQFIMVQSQSSAFRKGGSFQILSDLISTVFISKEEEIDKIYKSFKVHVVIEENNHQQNAPRNTTKDGWLSKSSSSAHMTSTKPGKVINYWCFNPGFGMSQLLKCNVRSIILTSGTLAPLKPLIAELDIPIAQRLENPHIVDFQQVYVKIIGSGPDREQLISNYSNRDNPKYIKSLGQTICNVARIVPDGLLVFFPSYPLLNQCVNAWQASGVWTSISQQKPIYVEPRNKESFTTTMEEFYKSIRDGRGACFMAVCRGKVSEGLDFADKNGRAVIITGLPYPPLKDPKVILKRRYLEENRTKENELLTGQAWYGLDATRAVNQAIGRVIRHRNDYGAILLCDARFQQPTQVQQLSKWIRRHLGDTPKSSAFGPVVKELIDFFKNADKTLAKPKERSVESLVSETCEHAGVVVRSAFFAEPKQNSESKTKFQDAQNLAIKIEKTNSIPSWTPNDYAKAAGQTNASGRSTMPMPMDFMSRLNSDVRTIDFNSSTNSANNNQDGLVSIHKRSNTSSNSTTTENDGNARRKRFKLIGNDSFTKSPLKNSSGTSTLASFGFTSQSQTSSSCNPIDPTTTTRQQAPEDRVEFLRLLRSSLTPDNFTAFTDALLSYRNDNTFDELMDLLVKLLGGPKLRYILLGMRRFMRAEHKSKFDEIIQVTTEST